MYYVYILKCGDGSLYTGITNNLPKRLADHAAGKGSKFVRSRLPFQLVHSEEAESRSAALKREAVIKRLSKAEKLEFLNNIVK